MQLLLLHADALIVIAAAFSTAVAAFASWIHGRPDDGDEP
jgi:hypothetical protein